jgi:hypothetical protein
MHMDLLSISTNCELDIIVGQRVAMSNTQIDYNCKHEVFVLRLEVII